jgi:hypothetical protein
MTTFSSLFLCFVISSSSSSFFFLHYFSYYVWMNVSWLVCISIARLTRFIIQIHLSTIYARFFHLVLLSLALFISLRMCKNMCVCVCKWVSMHWRMEANTHTCRDNIKKNETQKKERHPFIHSFIHCLFSSLTSVKMMVVIFFFEVE